jgi:hypothetical protein
VFDSKCGEKLALHKALLFLGDVYIANKDEDTANNLYTVALEGFTYMGIHQSQAQTMLRLGDLAHKRGQSTHTISLWTVAQPLFEQSLQAKHITQIDSRLLAAEQNS